MYSHDSACFSRFRVEHDFLKFNFMGLHTKVTLVIDMREDRKPKSSSFKCLVMVELECLIAATKLFCQKLKNDITCSLRKCRDTK